jgi:RNA polymerase sigma factor (TIGR02999 family)
LGAPSCAAVNIGAANNAAIARPSLPVEFRIDVFSFSGPANTVFSRFNYAWRGIRGKILKEKMAPFPPCGAALYTNRVSDAQKAAAGSTGNLTLLLNRMQNGDHAAAAEAASRIYGELHRIASREMRRERPGHILQTTALVTEAYLRLSAAGSLEIQSRGHFMAMASQQMRRILVDHARSAGAQRRGGGAVHIQLDAVQAGADARSLDLLVLDDSLAELERIDPRAAKVVELRYFGGYTDKEVVEALGVSLATVRRDWEFARSWLFRRMQSPGDPANARVTAGDVT